VSSAAIGCKILAGVAAVVIYGFTVVSSRINRRRSTMGIAETRRDKLTGFCSLSRYEPEAA